MEVNDVIDKHCSQTVNKVDFGKLFAFAEENDIDVSDLREQVDQPYASGRVRMIIGNRLRSRRKTHDLVFNGQVVAKADGGDQ